MNTSVWISSRYRAFQASEYWRDVAWLSSGTALAQLVGVLMMPVLSRVFQPAEFAIQNLFVQVTGIVTILITLRYEYFVQLPKSEDDAIRMVYLVLFIGGMFCLLISPLLWLFQRQLASLLGQPHVAPWLMFVPITSIAVAISVVLQGYIQRCRKFRASANAEVAAKAGFFGSALVGHSTLPGAGGLIVSALGGACAKIWVLLREFHPIPIGSVSCYIAIFRIYSRMSVALIYSHLMLACTAIAPVLFISHLYGGDVLGQYSLAFQAVSLPAALLGKAVGSVYAQRAAERWAHGESFDDLWRSTAKKLLLVGIPVYTISAALMPWLFPVVFGGSWHAAGFFGAILSVNAFFSFVTSPMDRGCLTVGAWWYSPTWHTMRALSTSSVAFLAWKYALPITDFLILFAVQEALLYLVDYWFQWRFSKMKPAQGYGYAVTS